MQVRLDLRLAFVGSILSMLIRIPHVNWYRDGAPWSRPSDRVSSKSTRTIEEIRVTNVGMKLVRLGTLEPILCG